jgi:hypothetical protein
MRTWPLHELNTARRAELSEKGVVLSLKCVFNEPDNLETKWEEDKLLASLKFSVSADVIVLLISVQ